MEDLYIMLTFLVGLVLGAIIGFGITEGQHCIVPNEIAEDYMIDCVSMEIDGEPKTVCDQKDIYEPETNQSRKPIR